MRALTNPSVSTQRASSWAAAVGSLMGSMAKPAKRPLLFYTAVLSSSLDARQVSKGAEPFVGPCDITCSVTEPSSMSLSRPSPRSGSFFRIVGGKSLPGVSVSRDTQERVALETKCSSRVTKVLVLAIIMDAYPKLSSS